MKQDPRARNTDSPSRIRTTVTRLALITLIFFAGFCWAQNEAILTNFVAFPQGDNPESSLIADVAGNLYGTTMFGGKHGSGSVFKMTPSPDGTWSESVIYDFRGEADGAEPMASLIFDASGNLYGTTSSGGSGCTFDLCGAVFELSPNSRGSWTESVLYSFNGRPNDGQTPVASLVFDAAGNLYGTTESGGSQDNGTVFELSRGPNGTWNESILHDFSGGADGAYPFAGLILDSSGNLYGATKEGGADYCGGSNPTCGVVFELIPQGDGTWNENVLHTFSGNDGFYPQGGLIFDSAGDLYGTTTQSLDNGTVFRLHRESSGTWIHTILYSFRGSANGAYPASSLIFGKRGQLYGTTMRGGSPGVGCGTVFELTPGSKGSWKENVIHRFYEPAGSGACPMPSAGLLLDSRDRLYGTTPFAGNLGGFCSYQQGSNGCGTVFELRKESGQEWGLKLLYAFPPGRLGVSPASGLLADDQGNYYGTTESGGSNTCFASTGSGCGTVVKVTPRGNGRWDTEVLYNFKGTNDGATPRSALIRDTAGNLYGTTQSGGVAGCIGLYNLCGGTVYELSPTAEGWKETVLHRFRPGEGGVTPIARPVMDSEGNLYGTTVGGGGSMACDKLGCGTIFKLSPTGNGNWQEEVLYAFKGGADGSGPLGTLILDDQGSLYGTTSSGGAKGEGTVFKLTWTSGAWQEAVIYSFQGSPNDGASPWAGVIADSNGNLFGTTYSGGVNTGDCASSGCGVVFELSPSGPQWKETVLLKFRGPDGAEPVSALSMDEAGNLFGTAPYTAVGGWGGGTVFELSPGSSGWTKRILHRFERRGDGRNPEGPVILDRANHIYGTTSSGGSGLAGTVFELSTGDF